MHNVTEASHIHLEGGCPRTSSFPHAGNPPIAYTPTCTDTQTTKAHPGLLLLCVLVQVKVPDPPVPYTSPQLQGAAQEGLVQSALYRAPLLHLGLHHGVPGSVLNKPAA